MQNADALRDYFSRVQAALPELFNMAHAICGNYELAEYALQCTLMEAWLGDSRGSMGFREGLRNILRREALAVALEERAEVPELTWNGLCTENDDEVLALLTQESVEVRRILALRYGCGFSVGRIVRLTGLPSSRVQEALERCERRVRRRLESGQRRGGEGYIAKAVRREFSRTDAAMPSQGAMYRAFAAEAAEMKRPSRLPSRMLRYALCILLAVLCAVSFWFAAVLMQPSGLSREAAHQEIVESA